MYPTNWRNDFSDIPTALLDDLEKVEMPLDMISTLIENYRLSPKSEQAKVQAMHADPDHPIKRAINSVAKLKSGTGGFEDIINGITSLRETYGAEYCGDPHCTNGKKPLEPISPLAKVVLELIEDKGYSALHDAISEALPHWRPSYQRVIDGTVTEEEYLITILAESCITPPPFLIPVLAAFPSLDDAPGFIWESSEGPNKETLEPIFESRGDTYSKEKCIAVLKLAAKRALLTR